MHLLSCPNCQAEIHVTPAQAGDSIPCPKCREDVAIPKLGELRNLPKVDTEQGPENPVRTRPVGGTVAFVTLSMVAVAAFLVAGYNSVRWLTIKPEMTTESHLVSITEEFAAAEPASMVKEFEGMEVHSLDMTAPYNYQVTVNEKNRLRNNSLIAGGIVLLCGIGAFAAASLGTAREG